MPAPGTPAQILASGVGVPWALEAQELLEKDWGVSADVWSVTSWSELRRDGVAADQHAMLHPDEPAAGPVIAALAIGILLFVGSSAFALWRTTGEVLRGRLVIVGVTVAAMALVASAAPVWPLAAVAVGLAAIVATEHGRERHEPVDALDVE